MTVLSIDGMPQYKPIRVWHRAGNEAPKRQKPRFSRFSVRCPVGGWIVARSQHEEMFNPQAVRVFWFASLWQRMVVGGVCTCSSHPSPFIERHRLRAIEK